jgi:DNA helicase TIP49 (TBP-interacting protein)
MREIKVGSRVIYEHEVGGINALVTAAHDHRIDLVFVLPSGKVGTKKNVPNVYFAKEEKEVDQIVKEGVEVTDIREIKSKRGVITKVGKVKRMCNVANGFWRR